MQTPPSCADVLIAISLIDSLHIFDTDSLQEEKEKAPDLSLATDLLKDIWAEKGDICS